ncbi:MAG: 4Fe-4S cluster-binding domain-containing protein [Agathobacter sp.]|nr:4Fe-4S cluster-binding domain-containing protein [Agathobacter sp.]
MKMQTYDTCMLCPRACGVNRTAGARGVCGQSANVKLARAALHFWEEPCISGTNGSGAVFFCGCSLQCVFCQNREIATGQAGVEISDERLAEIFLELQEQHANNINLVTPGHYAPHVIAAVESARRQGLCIPIVYNTGSYETVDTIKSLEGIVDVYLPDFKYMDPELAGKYSHAKDYPKAAKAAIAEMVRQQPQARFVPEPQVGSDNDTERKVQTQIQVMTAGVIVRHLLLPGLLYDSKHILKYLYEQYGNQIYYSLMSQYTPLAHVKDYPELTKRVSEEAYAHLVHYAEQLGIANGFTQEHEVAEESFIPHFDCEGVLSTRNSG